jgi:hypothetical protein
MDSTLRIIATNQCAANLVQNSDKRELPTLIEVRTTKKSDPEMLSQIQHPMQPAWGVGSDTQKHKKSGHMSISPFQKL